MKIIFTIFLITFCSFNLFAQSNITPEEYLIYEKVFASIYADNYKHDQFKTSFVVSENTVKSDFVPQSTLSKTVSDFLKEKTPNIIEGLLGDFNEKNKTSAELENKFSDEYKLYVIPKDEIENLLTQGKKEHIENLKKCNCLYSGSSSWFQPLYKKYPNSYGYYNLSRIGFSSDKKTAAVFINKVSGDQGSAMFYILTKSDDKWKVNEQIYLFSWIT